MRRLSDRVNRRKPRGETLVSSRKRLPTIQSRVIAIKPPTGFRGRASGAKIPCARCIPWYPLLITQSPFPITHYPKPFPGRAKGAVAYTVKEVERSKSGSCSAVIDWRLFAHFFGLDGCLFAHLFGLKRCLFAHFFGNRYCV